MNAATIRACYMRGFHDAFRKRANPDPSSWKQSRAYRAGWYDGGKAYVVATYRVSDIVAAYEKELENETIRS